jgi:hypothetical protein
LKKREVHSSCDFNLCDFPLQGRSGSTFYIIKPEMNKTHFETGPEGPELEGYQVEKKSKWFLGFKPPINPFLFRSFE